MIRFFLTLEYVGNSSEALDNTIVADSKATAFTQNLVDLDINSGHLALADAKLRAPEGGRAFRPIVTRNSKRLFWDTDKILVDDTVFVFIQIDQNCDITCMCTEMSAD